MTSEIETNMVSVERISEYQNTPQEAPFRSGICAKYFLLFPQTTFHQKNWDKPSVCFSIFEWWNLKLYPKKPFGTWQFGKIGVWVNFIIQKLRFSLSQFSLAGGFFERTRENILQIFRALVYLKMIPPKNGHNTGLWNSKIIKPDTGKVRNAISVSCMYSVFGSQIVLIWRVFLAKCTNQKLIYAPKV